MLQWRGMRRIPLTLRALMLVPLLGAGLDHLRVAAFCPGGTESCLQAAGGGAIGPVGAAVLVLYAAAIGLSMRWLAGGSRARRWLAASGGLLAVCAGHAALAAALGPPGAVASGGWLELLPLILAAGALLAVALRAAPAALRLLRRLRPRAPRARAAAVAVRHARAASASGFSRVAALTAAGRAPPPALA